MWVAISLVSLILIIILILCVPLDFVFHADTKARPRLRLNFVWFFGLIDKEIKKGKEKLPEKDKLVKPEKKSKRRFDSQFIFRIIKIRGLFTQFKQLLINILSCFKLKELFIDIKIHTDDPADMGILFPLTLSLNNLADSFLPYQIHIWPSFEAESIFDGTLTGAIRLQPVRLLKPAAQFIFSMPAARLFYTFASTKWKKEK